jgi:hypothetical protein
MRFTSALRMKLASTPLMRLNGMARRQNVDPIFYLFITILGLLLLQITLCLNAGCVKCSRTNGINLILCHTDYFRQILKIRLSKTALCQNHSITVVVVYTGMAYYGNASQH